MLHRCACVGVVYVLISLLHAVHVLYIGFHAGCIGFTVFYTGFHMFCIASYRLLNYPKAGIPCGPLVGPRICPVLHVNWLLFCMCSFLKSSHAVFRVFLACFVRTC